MSLYYWFLINAKTYLDSRRWGCCVYSLQKQNPCIENVWGLCNQRSSSDAATCSKYYYDHEQLCFTRFILLLVLMLFFFHRRFLDLLYYWLLSACSENADFSMQMLVISTFSKLLLLMSMLISMLLIRWRKLNLRYCSSVWIGEC